MNPLQFILVALLRLYQLLVSPVLAALCPSGICRFDPSCSNYALQAVKRHGGVVLAEAYVSWKKLIDEQSDLIDPSVRVRFYQGRDMSSSDVETVRTAIRELTPKLYQRMAGYDALVAPTVPIPPPPIAEVENNADNYRVANGRALRNTQLGNLLACCALTLPVACDVSPAGLMIMAPAGDDNRLLRVGEAIERTIAFHKQDSNE